MTLKRGSVDEVDNPQKKQMTATKDIRRALHWVFKVGNLKKTVEFYEKVIGLHVLRHEEFNSGCEATCNGPYSRPWSKTMIGYGPEQNNFVLELTYNYGVKKYAQGDDLQYIAIKAQDIEAKAQENGLEVEEVEGSKFVASPDGYKFKLVADEDGPDGDERFSSVCIRVADLDRARDYYTNVLEMKTFSETEGKDGKRVVVGYDAKQCKLELLEAADKKGTEVDHAKAFGRIAFATREGAESVHKLVVDSKDKVINEPIKLDTPGKATVEVTIIADRDDYEICFVETTGFDSLSATKPGDEHIDWEARAKLGADRG